MSTLHYFYILIYFFPLALAAKFLMYTSLSNNWFTSDSWPTVGPKFFNAAWTIFLAINLFADGKIMFKGLLDLLYPGKNSLRVIGLILVPGFLPGVLLEECISLGLVHIFGSTT